MGLKTLYGDEKYFHYLVQSEETVRSCTKREAIDSLIRQREQRIANYESLIRNWREEIAVLESLKEEE